MAVLLVVRFLAELGMLACLGVGGWQLGDSWLESAAFGTAAPLAAAATWGRWVAPRAPRRLTDPERLAVEVTLFAAALLMVLAGDPSGATIALGVAVWAAFVISIPSRGHEPGPSPAPHPRVRS